MADTDDVNTMEVKTEELKPLVASRVLRLVSVTFDADSNADTRYKARYGTSGNKNRVYNYITDLEFLEGDFAVVDTADVSGYTVVRVQSIGEPLVSAPSNHKWIIDKVDVNAHKERKEREKRKEFLLQTLAKKASEVKAQLKFEELLGSDEDAKKMLDELKSLQ